jgi:hypothetical protein
MEWTSPVGRCPATHPILGRCDGIPGHPRLGRMLPSREHGSPRGWWREPGIFGPDDDGYWAEWAGSSPNPKSKWFPEGNPPPANERGVAAGRPGSRHGAAG